MYHGTLTGTCFQLIYPWYIKWKTPVIKNRKHIGAVIMHNFSVHVYRLVAASLFATFSVFCFQLSIVLLDANKSKLPLQLQLNFSTAEKSKKS